jgi:hypothetical protein
VVPSHPLPFPVFQQYTLLFTVANGAIAQQTLEAYAAYVLPQLHNILAHSNPRPFAGNLEGHEDGVDEDMMTGDLLYPNPLYPNPLYPSINSAQQHCTLPNSCILLNNICTLPTAPTPPLSHTYPHLLALVFHLTPTTPWPICTPTRLPQPLALPPHHHTKPAQDTKARSKANKETRHRRKRRRAPLTPPSHALLSCVLPRRIFIATTMTG